MEKRMRRSRPLESCSRRLLLMFLILLLSGDCKYGVVQAQEIQIIDDNVTETLLATALPTVINTTIEPTALLPTTFAPSGSILPSARPSFRPTIAPTLSRFPSIVPSTYHSPAPTLQPSKYPTLTPSVPPSPAPTFSHPPSSSPSERPSNEPTISSQPSFTPSISMMPSVSSMPSTVPTLVPSISPSPSRLPTVTPSQFPTLLPSTSPSTFPSSVPTVSLQNISQSNIRMVFAGMVNNFTAAEVEAWRKITNDHVQYFWNNWRLSPIHVGGVDTQFLSQEREKLGDMPPMRRHRLLQAQTDTDTDEDDGISVQVIAGSNDNENNFMEDYNATSNDNSTEPVYNNTILSVDLLVITYKQVISYGAELINPQVTDLRPYDVLLFEAPFLYDQLNYINQVALLVNNSRAMFLRKVHVDETPEPVPEPVVASRKTADKQLIILAVLLVLSILLLAAGTIWYLIRRDEKMNLNQNLPPYSEDFPTSIHTLPQNTNTKSMVRASSAGTILVTPANDGGTGTVTNTPPPMTPPRYPESTLRISDFPSTIDEHSVAVPQSVVEGGLPNYTQSSSVYATNSLGDPNFRWTDLTENTTAQLAAPPGMYGSVNNSKSIAGITAASPRIPASNAPLYSYFTGGGNTMTSSTDDGIVTALNNDMVHPASVSQLPVQANLADRLDADDSVSYASSSTGGHISYLTLNNNLNDTTAITATDYYLNDPPEDDVGPALHAFSLSGFQMHVEELE